MEIFFLLHAGITAYDAMHGQWADHGIISRYGPLIYIVYLSHPVEYRVEQ